MGAAYQSSGEGITFPGGDIPAIDSPTNKINVAPGALNEKLATKTAAPDKNGFNKLFEAQTAIPFLIAIYLLWKYK